VFLAVERFDRVGPTGRRGMVSLRALGAFHGAPLDSWTDAATALRREGAIGEATWERAVWCDRFGDLIGNTDRHAGNRSLRLDDGRVGALTPVYDMLPMLYAPRAGEVRTPALPAPPPTPHLPHVWRAVLPLAARFWHLVASDPAIAPELRAVAGTNATAVEARLPLLDHLSEPTRSQDPRLRVGFRR
jgi:hypothetical protein